MLSLSKHEARNAPALRPPVYSGLRDLTGGIQLFRRLLDIAPAATMVARLPPRSRIAS